MIKQKIKHIATTFTLAAALLLAGCATTPSTLQNEVKLEGIDSNSTRVSRLYLIPSDSTTLLRGEVTRRIHAHGQIPGHLHIELISPEGKVIKEADIGYSTPSSTSHSGDFELALPSPIPAGSTIRVTHHDLISHQQDVIESPWRDVDGNQ